MGSVKLEGNLDEELLEAGWIACQITECVSCEGSGWWEWPYSAEDEAGRKCTSCDNTGYILDLDTAIACKVKTTVEITG